ncbi:MAG: glycosyltransferase family 39 protein, partial [Burkholderiales bacterium]|nr:glycosyltransferase family 39 protein [Anaerolineae bacterium]
MPYWISSTLAATPAFAWIYCGLGVIWALVALPRKDWRDVPLVLCAAFALGPGLLTTWMFILGTIGGASEQPLMRPDLIFGGTIAMALMGAAIVWRKYPSPSPVPASGEGLALDEKLLIALIVAALVLQWLSVAYWPFTAYDTLWVYGYEGRLYSLFGYIPTHIDYYPQFVPLQYAYGQLAVGGLGFVDDHAARAVLPFMHVGSILAVYALGSRLFTRRTGIFAAALWALYPHVGEWSRFGDLEIPVAFLFTAAAAFFLMAWTGQELRRRYAAIAGIMFGIAMWTKPTAGAFAWGVALLVGAELLRLRFDWRVWWPKFEIALITTLAAVPLGGMWYVRNLLLGHNPIDFPPSYWLTQAQRSGAEFGWPLLALLTLLAYLYLAPRSTRPNLLRVLVGLALVVTGLLPSIIEPHRMELLEWLALTAGSVLLAITLWNYYLKTYPSPSPLPASGEGFIGRVAYALLLALPYLVTWFYSYSYHYRLSFAIVPLLLLPTAVILAHWFTRERIAALNLPLRLAYLASIALIGIPGVISTLNDAYAGTDWLLTDELPDDFQRYNSGNRALMNVVGGIQSYLREHDEAPIIVAPAEQRLPFFFPLMDIRTDDVPTDLDELNGVTYFIYSSQSGGAYEQIPLAQSQVFAALGRGADVMRH